MRELSADQAGLYARLAETSCVGDPPPLGIFQMPFPPAPENAIVVPSGDSTGPPGIPLGAPLVSSVLIGDPSADAGASMIAPLLTKRIEPPSLVKLGSVAPPARLVTWM